MCSAAAKAANLNLIRYSDPSRAVISHLLEAEVSPDVLASLRICQSLAGRAAGTPGAPKAMSQEMDFSSLGVSVESQSSFEQRVLAKAEAAAAKAEAEAKIKLNEQRSLLVANIETLSKKLKSPAYSAARQQEMLGNQLKDLEKKLQDIDRAAQREADPRKDASAILEGAPGVEESERNRLIRTGVITPFAGIDGSEKKRLSEHVGPDVDKRQDRHHSRHSTARIDHVVPKDRSHSVIARRPHPITQSDREARVQLSPKRRRNKRQTLSKSNDSVDDGDEASYQKRINASREKRKKRRIDVDGDGEDVLENEDAEHIDSSESEDDVQFSGGYAVPKRLYDRLFPYQRTAVKWMWELHCQEAGGIVGDEMGLGKTVQTVAFLAGLHHSGLLHGPVLLLCPATIMAQWVRHLHDWYPPLRVVLVHDSGSHARAAGAGEGRQRSAEKLVRDAFRRGGVVVTTYDHLRIHADLMTSQVWHCPYCFAPPSVRTLCADGRTQQSAVCRRRSGAEGAAERRRGGAT